jgi:hypothetical protein
MMKDGPKTTEVIDVSFELAVFLVERLKRLEIRKNVTRSQIISEIVSGWLLFFEDEEGPRSR